MIKTSLTRPQRRRLEQQLRKKSQLQPRILPRIQCVLLRDEGKKPQVIADLLKVHRNTVTNWVKLFNEQGETGLLNLNYQGREPFLNDKQQAKLEQQLEKELFTRLKDIQNWVDQKFRTRYSASGMAKVIDRLGYTKKQTGLVPGKADPDKQKAFLKEIPSITA